MTLKAPAEFDRPMRDDLSMSRWWDDFPADERALLTRVWHWPHYPALQDLSHETLIQLTRDEGMDFAVALLYTRLLRVPRNGAFAEKVRTARHQPRTISRKGVTLAFCPGAYYRQITRNGADGRVFREAAEPYVREALLVPTGSSATVAENGAFICDWLLQRPASEPIVLASLSKGSSDIKAALSHPRAAAAFQNVHGWINVSGTLNGLPIFNWLLRRPLLTAGFRLLFWSRGLDFRVVPNLRWGKGEALDFPLQLPDGVNMLTVVGFPLERHFGHPLLRKNRRRMLPWGPNDGLMLLWDACQLPGVVYPVWGADHFLRPGGDSRRLANELAGIVVEELVGDDRFEI